MNKSFAELCGFQWSEKPWKNDLIMPDDAIDCIAADFYKSPSPFCRSLNGNKQQFIDCLNIAIEEAASQLGDDARRLFSIKEPTWLVQ